MEKQVVDDIMKKTITNIMMNYVIEGLIEDKVMT